MGRLGERGLMGIFEDGRDGELELMSWLKTLGFKVFQPDCIGIKDGVPYMFEFKHQEMFKRPPFDGQGLPRWQVEARLKFEELTGIKVILVVKDKETGIYYSQFLRKLDEGKYFDTHGLKPRRIYPLANFNKYEPSP
jgi:GNAT superfamily N-acetyltransferase